MTLILSATTSRVVRGIARGPALCLLASIAPAQDASPETDSRPRYSFLRQVENWSDFVPARPAEDLFDPIKHVRLTDDDSVWVSFGGRLESRVESWSEFDFGAAPPGVSSGDSFIVSRALTHADLHVGDHLRAFVEGKSAQSTDRDLPGGRRTLDMDTLALQQAFVDLTLPLGEAELMLRVGRQMLLFGNQRLVSPLPWGNTLRTWEGVTTELRQGSWTVHGLATWFVPVNKTEPNERDEDNILWGVHATQENADSPGGRDLFLLGNERNGVNINGTSGDERRLTLGTRTWGPIGAGFDHEVELAWQLGEVATQDVQAWSIASQFGWKPGGLAGDPRLFLGLDLASGDDEPGGDVGTFHQLFPLGHAYLGYVDVIGRQNIADLSLGSEWSLPRRTSLSLALHIFQLMDTNDAIYNAGGVPYRTGAESKEVGSEIDLLLRTSVGKHTQAYLGYSHFFAGPAIEETGPSEDIDFAYVGVSFTF